MMKALGFNVVPAPKIGLFLLMKTLRLFIIKKDQLFQEDLLAE